MRVPPDTRLLHTINNTEKVVGENLRTLLLRNPLSPARKADVGVPSKNGSIPARDTKVRRVALAGVKAGRFPLAGRQAGR